MLDKIHEHVNKQLERIVKWPRMFGDQQAVEMQVLTLLEIKYIMKGLTPDNCWAGWRYLIKQSTQKKSASLSGQGLEWDIFMNRIKEFINMPFFCD